MGTIGGGGGGGDVLVAAVGLTAAEATAEVVVVVGDLVDEVGDRSPFKLGTPSRHTVN